MNGLNTALSSDEARVALDAAGGAAKALAVILAGRLAVSAVASTAALASTTAEAYRYQVALASAAGVSKTAAISITALSVAGRVVGASLALLTGPLGAVIAIAGTAAVAVYGYRDSADDAAGASENLAQKTDWLNASLEGLTKNQAASALLGVQQEMVATQLRSLDAQSAVQMLESQLRQYPDSSQAAAWRNELTRQRGVIDDVAIRIAGLGQQILVLNGIIAAPDGVKALSSEYQKFEASISRQIALMGKTGQAAAYRYDLEHGELAKLSDEEKQLVRAKLTSLEAAEKQAEAARRHGSATKKETYELEGLIKRLEQQRATLGMTSEEAERYSIETASGTDAQRKQALATYDQIQAWRESEKAIQQAMDSGRQYLAFQRELEVFQQRMSLEVAGVGMSDRQREVAEQELSIRQEYAQKRLDLERSQQVASTALEQSQYEERLRLLSESENAKLEMVTQSATARSHAEGEWQNGAIRSLKNYEEEVSRVSSSVEDLFTNAFGGMEDALTSFVKTGKLSFGDLANSIIEDMIRIMIQQAVMGPLAGFMGGGIASLFGGGRATGGPVEAGKMYEVNETGMPELLNIGGKQLLMMAGDSGVVTPLRASSGGMGQLSMPAIMADGVQGGNAVSVEVNVSSGGGTQVNAPAGWEQFAKEIGEFVDAKIRARELKSQRQGGTAWKARQGAFS